MTTFPGRNPVDSFESLAFGARAKPGQARWILLSPPLFPFPKLPGDLSMVDAAHLLATIHEKYDELVRLTLRAAAWAEPDTLLEMIGQLAWFAYIAHPGCFADPRVENLALKLGQEADGCPAAVDGYAPHSGSPARVRTRGVYFT